MEANKYALFVDSLSTIKLFNQRPELMSSKKLQLFKGWNYKILCIVIFSCNYQDIIWNPDIKYLKKGGKLLKRKGVNAIKICWIPRNKKVESWSAMGLRDKQY